MNLHEFILVRLIGMMHEPQSIDGRINLDSVNVPPPHLDTAYALVKLLSKMLSDQHGRLRIAST